MMEQIPYFLTYACILVFVVAVVLRARMWARIPMHVRWELYPVPHEAGRGHYGGSYLEASEWWTKKREVSKVAELKVMVPEMVFLVALREHNPRLWKMSFPFHFGIYMVMTSVALMLGAGVVQAVIPAVLAGSLGLSVQYAIVIIGVAGLALSILGAFGLLYRRLTVPELSNFTAPADIFNLVFFIAAFGVSLATFALADRDGALVTAFVANLVSFNPQALPATGMAAYLPLVSVTLLSLLLAYIPLTHMSHFVGKYFAYHQIRWNDTPNLPGGAQEAEIQKLLSQPITWAAAHIRAEGGKRTWADVATDIATEETK
jgi:nitrate reductase gamma subunit